MSGASLAATAADEYTDDRARPGSRRSPRACRFGEAEMATPSSHRPAYRRVGTGILRTSDRPDAPARLEISERVGHSHTVLYGFSCCPRH